MGRYPSSHRTGACQASLLPRPSLRAWLRGAAGLGLDVLLYLSVNAGLAVLFTRVEPTQRGFYCDDTSIQYPYRGDTIPVHLLLSGGLVGPLITIFVLEFVWKVLKGRRKSRRYVLFLVSAFKLSGQFLFGVSLVMLTTEAIKATTGRLRPHFIDTCQPDVFPQNCTSGYMTEYTCTSNVSHAMSHDIHKSFPSGHASFSAYAGTFLTIYLEHRLIMCGSYFLRPVLQMGLLMLIVLCAVTRVTDSRHHVGDVIAGVILGVCVALWLFLWIPMHKRKQEAKENMYPDQALNVKTDNYIYSAAPKNDVSSSPNTPSSTASAPFHSTKTV